MIYSIFLSLFLFTGLAMAEDTSFVLASQEKSQTQHVSSLRIILSKLNETLKANKDLDALKDLGMADNDIKRLKTATSMKVQQLTEDAIYVIQTL
ncbi:MAG: hypothetical protein CO186_06185 [Zetaproteobacteria bacterium CG_4_9_14_3_um_filter_49_83]|nr:MAG: hypothetical protein AUJ56_12605 [Zetaproteobacteria bacterium CG1_02_49_23]PIQ34340.1 MAG: hypothetical protein COW62_02220 [Zetaproteobacteria bacterium CG17_big_fil_post_rev_8_21_14_2_50_50_13]PIV29903.1 MAG: hypothetical protein COS35_09525 [Zetaproteobacteria bacterium CG02_land_8_20_14_3_00_50_9]PIY56150.1 MAG: hypothetical protein COZ00_05695 [Zetaproteobacteria bacterium CG_4_10_14_0_8_um_filter_49_80]PJA35375.1 MAG: hypothetical protein CO186_06185 [Zetaproteobacteria bacterium